jgi:hypothetical protein
MKTALACALIIAAIIGSVGYASYSFGHVSGYEAGYSPYNQDYDRDYTSGDEVRLSEGLAISQYIGLSSEDTELNPSHSITLNTPTFNEIRSFVIADQTSRNEWQENVYECRHFAADLCHNAREAGWDCALVLLCFDKEQHAVVAFNTSDRGLIYLEPGNDAIIYPQVSGTYQGKEIKEILVFW